MRTYAYRLVALRPATRHRHWRWPHGADRGVRAVATRRHGHGAGEGRDICRRACAHGTARPLSVDNGGHHFFTKNSEIERLWTKILGDGLLTCRRLSRIYYRRRFFRYPLRGSLGAMETLRFPPQLRVGPHSSQARGAQLRTWGSSATRGWARADIEAAAGHL